MAVFGPNSFGLKDTIFNLSAGSFGRPDASGIDWLSTPLQSMASPSPSASGQGSAGAGQAMRGQESLTKPQPSSAAGDPAAMPSSSPFGQMMGGGAKPKVIHPASYNMAAMGHSFFGGEAMQASPFMNSLRGSQ